MAEQLLDIAGDFVRVATCGTPTEAYLLKGVLEAAGLTPNVADANVVQANSWMTQAVGGVRVLVPASQASAAREAIAEFNAGAYQLEGEDAPRVERIAELQSPVFSPDRAALLSFILTPAFGAAVQLANASTLGLHAHRLRGWLWLVFLASTSLAAVFVVHRMSPGPLLVFRASFVLSFVTAVWYFLAGQEQSKHILSAYGPKYPQRRIARLVVAVAVFHLFVGWVFSELA
jgi:hypothetical protein